MNGFQFNMGFTTADGGFQGTMNLEAEGKVVGP